MNAEAVEEDRRAVVAVTRMVYFIMQFRNFYVMFEFFIFREIIVVLVGCLHPKEHLFVSSICW